MAATITLDPWCIGDDETVAVYIYSDAAARDKLRTDLTGATTLTKVKTLLAAALDAGVI